MNKVLTAFGGRKMVVIIIAMILVALREQLGLDADAVTKIMTIALGGTGVIALEDSIKAISAPTKKKKPGG